MDLGELWGSLNLDDTKFGEVLKGALGSLSDFKGKAGALAGAAGATLAAAFVASATQGMRLDAAQDRVAAQLDLTEEEAARAGDAAAKAYAGNFGESLEQVNDAVGVVIGSIKGMRDASEAELQKVTEAALTFSDVMEVDIERAAQVAGQAVTTGLADNATQAFDLLTAAAQKVPPALREDLLDAVDEYGPMFAQLGFTGEQAFGLLVDASAKGMYGIDKAGDAIKEFTIRSTDMSTASTDAYKAIGLDASDMAAAILAGGDQAKKATDKIIDGILGIEDPAKRANTAIALFGTPLEDLGTNEIPKFLQSLQGSSSSMEDFEGSTKRAADTLGGNSLATLTEWKRAAELAFLGLADWAIPAIDSTVKSIDGFLQPLGGAGVAVTVLAGLIGAVLIPALIAWGVQSTIAGTASAWAWTVTQWGAIKALPAQIIAFVTMAAGWVATAAAATAGAIATAAAWLIAVAPIALVIAAVALVVFLIIRYWDKIKAGTKAAWDWVVAQVKKVPGLIAGFFLNWTLPGLIIKHWATIKSAFSRGAAAVIGFVKDIPGKIKGFFSGALGWLAGVGEDIMSGLLSGIDTGLGWVKSKLEGVGRLIPGWLKKVLGINSPSTEMRDEVGLWIPAGVADGVDDGTARFLRPAVEAMSRAMMSDLTGTARVGVVGSLTSTSSPIEDGTAAAIAAAGGLAGMTPKQLEDAVARGAAKGIDGTYIQSDSRGQRLKVNGA